MKSSGAGLARHGRQGPGISVEIETMMKTASGATSIRRQGPGISVEIET